MRVNDIANHFYIFHLVGLSKKANYVWKGMWLAITKAIWSYRNKIIFDGGQVDEIEIFAVAQLYAWSWA